MRQYTRRLIIHLLGAMILLTALPASALAQTVRGQIVFRNGYPAPGVQVRVTHPRLGPSMPAVTGYDGMYYLYGIPPGDYQLEVFINGQLAPRWQVRVFNRPNTDIPPYRLPW